MSDKLKFECKFATYTKSLKGRSDIVFIKENIINPDGTTTPNTRIIKDMKRSFGLTKEAYRNHKEKKPYEDAKKVQMHQCYQWDLANSISKALGRGATDLPLKQVCRNPYVYGADIGLGALVKHQYETRFPDTFTQYKVSVFDIETDVVNEDNLNVPIMASLSFKNKSYTFVVRSFFSGESDADILAGLKASAHKHIGSILKERNLEPEFEIVNHPADGFVKLFAKAHEWKPDWITGWNSLGFDYQVVVDTLERAGINPADVMCDPSVPKEYRNIYYFPGKTHATKMGKDGEKSKRALANYEKWPFVEAPASFRWADSMCAYYYLRTAAGKELNYKLDTISRKILDGIGKLEFQAAAGFHGKELHEFMQTNYKYEYVVYNLFDCIVVEMMDEKTKDLSISVPSFCGLSDYDDFISQPNRIAEAMHFDTAERGQIWGTTSDQMRTEIDDNLQDLSDWIIMLPTELVAQNGKAMFKELPKLLSYVRTSTNDIDVEGAYPTGTVIQNVDQMTTWMEMTMIEGLDRLEYRRIAVNLAAGGAINNAGELARMLYKAPDTITLMKDFAEEKGITFNYMDMA